MSIPSQIITTSTTVSIQYAVAYCFAVACGYVTSLYVLVPFPIQQLDRDHPQQIRYRTIATVFYCWIVSYVYSWIFPSDDDTATAATTDPSNNSAVTTTTTMRVLRWGDMMLHESAAIIETIAQIMSLYTGPIVVMILELYLVMRQDRIIISIDSYIRAFYTTYIHSTWEPFIAKDQQSTKIETMMIVVENNTKRRWITLRALVIAPATEEWVFRACMISALLQSNLSRQAIVFVAPSFFGVAHAHHAIVKMKQGGMSISLILVQTLFQFAYTYLFGCYASFNYIRWRSVVAVTLAHAMCNAMGLPQLPFFRQDDSLYPYRWMLLGIHVAGLVGFWYML